MKKNTTLNIQFMSPHLFRDDLEEIENISKELVVKGFKIKFNNIEFDSLEEIPFDMEKVRDLEIVTSQPYISLRLGRYSQYLWSSDPDLITLGACHKISEVVSRRERKTLYRFMKIGKWLPALFFLGIYFLIKFIPEKTPKIYLEIILGIYILFLIWLIIATVMNIDPVVEFIKKRQKLGFVAKNKDAILVGIILAILSFLLGLIVRK